MEARSPNFAPRWFLLSWVGLYLVGCGGGTIDNSTVPPGTTPDVTITSVSPALGPRDGGIDVAIRGSGFADPRNLMEVTIGEVVASVTAANDTEITVTLPPTADEGPVNVKVTSTYGSAELLEAFTYESGEPVYGVYVDFILFDAVNPDQFEPALEDVIDAFAILIEPTVEPLAPAPMARDTCQTNPPASGLPNGIRLDAGAAVTIRSGGTTLSVPRTADLTYGFAQASTAINTWVQGTQYGLDAEGSATLDAFSVPDVFQTPAGDWGVTSHDIGLFDVNTGYTKISRNQSLALTWTGTPGEYFTIELYGYDFDTSQYIATEVIVCQVDDDGSFSVPGTEMAKLTQSDIVLVYMGRVTTSEFEFAPTESQGESATIDLQIGVLEFQ